MAIGIGRMLEAITIVNHIIDLMVTAHTTTVDTIIHTIIATLATTLHHIQDSTLELLDLAYNWDIKPKKFMPNSRAWFKSGLVQVTF